MMETRTIDLLAVILGHFSQKNKKKQLLFPVTVFWTGGEEHHQQLHADGLVQLVL